MNDRRSQIWGIVFLVGVAALGFRATQSEFGKAYVEERTVFATGEGEDSQVDEITGPATDADLAAHPDAESWTRFRSVDPGRRGDEHVSFSPAGTFGIWLSAFLTLAVFSFLFADNPFYRLAEAMFVGISAAYAMVVGIWTGVVQNLFGKLMPIAVKEHLLPGLKVEGEDPVGWDQYVAGDAGYWQVGWEAIEWAYVVPLVFGVMLLMRLSPVGGWISRWPLAFFIGATAGIRLVSYFESDFVRQIQATLIPLIAFEEDGSFDFGESIKNLVIVLGVLTSLAYFFFSVEHEGAFGRVSRVGIWFLMITFGASFGYTVMGRIALFAQRLEFLFDDWLWIIDPLVRRDGL